MCVKWDDRSVSGLSTTQHSPVAAALPNISFENINLDLYKNEKPRRASIIILEWPILIQHTAERIWVLLICAKGLHPP